MADEHVIARYRRFYRKLVGFYSRPYRERFGESMEQTFNDLCRERAKTGKGLLGFVLWTFVETLAAILKDNVSFNLMHNKNIFRIAAGTGLILLIPLIAMQVSNDWKWGFFDFVFAGGLLFGAGLTFELIARKGGTLAYTAAVGIACVAGLLLVWVNAAVGIIGDEDEANAMYLAVIIVGFVGVFLARFEARGMSRALVATAVVQAIVPVIALAWVPEERFAPGVMPVMGLNGAFVAMWLVSALLFRLSANSSFTSRGARQPGAPRESVAG